MIPAAALLAGAAVIGWWSPRALGRLAATGVGPATVLGWWLLAALGVVAGAAGSVVLLVLPGHGPAGAVLGVLHNCWSTLGHDGFPALDPLAGTGAAALLTAAAVRLARHAADRRRRRNVLHRRHLQALRLTGDERPLPTLWLPDDRPIAYSMGGRRPLVVASTGLADRLTEPELRAVLEHERAHVRGHHHALTGWAEVLGRALPFIPLMRELPTATRLLVELAADRTAAARCGAAPLRSALVRISPAHGPRRALAMTGGDTAIRLAHLDAVAREPRFAAGVEAVAREPRFAARVKAVARKPRFAARAKTTAPDPRPTTGAKTTARRPRFAAGVRAVVGGVAALLAPPAVAVALVVGAGLVVCP
ncbi:M56 family metallopeptidase [Amycolatopsis sp.]|uniref:M56 family metallopeptidase n=1 Tax=Amycolatopsis sp. TaxID=37632 RepID=UPI002D7E9893|nr:M56 family metallopeptidase [Amycolatopsis sp.]HET6706059.1 M56 family metallopeptidase [Amycolatopsis sp.]